MKKLYKLWPFNFGALHTQNFDRSKIVIVPIPFESSVSFNSGTAKGPYAIISNSRFLDELYDDQGDQLIGLQSQDLFTLNEAELSKNSLVEAQAAISQLINDEVLQHNKFPLVLGGEHSVTYGVLKALKKKYPDISVLQFDAHTDMINSYEGSKFSHACVMRRLHDLNIPTVSIGIRNVNVEIQQYLKRNKLGVVYGAPKIPAATEVVKHLTKNVYITFDLDSLDPSIMPAVGTPEPGGLQWYDVLNSLEAIFRKVNVVGADVVELMPIPGYDAPNFLAAKLVYSMCKFKINQD